MFSVEVELKSGQCLCFDHAPDDPKAEGAALAVVKTIISTAVSWWRDGNTDDAWIIIRGEEVAAARVSSKAVSVFAPTHTYLQDRKKVAMSVEAYGALVALQKNPQSWSMLGGRLKGYLNKYELVDAEHRITAAGKDAIAGWTHVKRL